MKTKVIIPPEVIKQAETHSFNWYEKEDREMGKQSFLEGYKLTISQPIQDILKQRNEMLSMLEKVILILFFIPCNQHFKNYFHVFSKKSCKNIWCNEKDTLSLFQQKEIIT